MAGALVVLIGPMAAGKTRIGKRVAKQLGVPFIDSDKVIVAEHGPVAGIFAEHGEPRFRELEAAVVLAALEEPAVVSLGGGAPMTPAVAQALAGHDVVLLTTSAEAVESRIGDGKRPLLADRGIEAWIELLEQRLPTYQALATHTVDTSRRPIDHIAAELADRVRAREHLA